MTRKTVELQMAPHPVERTVMAPPFYHAMIDVAYGFQAKAYLKARIKPFSIYALVIVCISTGATSILALENIEAQSIVQAIERHSCQHGLPAQLFVDNGTQLIAMTKAKFTIQDLSTQLHYDTGIKISVSNPKAHSERGRVERRIGLLRKMLATLTTATDKVLTVLEWETLFKKAGNLMDEIPVAKGNSSSGTTSQWELLTPNRAKLGRNNNRDLVSATRLEDFPRGLQDALDRGEQVLATWYKILIENLHYLALKPAKWTKQSERQPKIGDLVLFLSDDSGGSTASQIWKLGRVVTAQPRQITIEHGSKRASTQERPRVNRSPRDVTILYSLHELHVNTREHAAISN